MTYTELGNLTSMNLRDLLTFPSIDTPSFYPIILFGIFIVMTLVSFFREVERERRGNFLSSSAVAGVITTVTAFLMSSLGLIQTRVVISCLVISSIFVVIYMLTGRND